LIGVTDVDIQLAFIMTIVFILVLTLLSLFLLYKGIGIKN